MDIYVFSSNSITNIWAGVGARKWAVSQKLAKKPATITKARKVFLGSLGIIYCSETKELTTPFLFASSPNEIEILDIWPEDWGLPFQIVPLGTPKKRISASILRSELPSVKGLGKAWNKILYVQPDFSFQASTISNADWAFLFERLAD